MDKEWSEKNKAIQALLSKEATYKEALDRLIEFRGEMFGELRGMLTRYPREALYQRPFAGASGYHSKTLAYSAWHIFRIEDIVAHEMIAEDRQVFFDQGFDASIHSPIITTGNELTGDGIEAFSRQLEPRALCRYAQAVMESSNQLLKRLEYSDLKRRFGEAMNAKLRQTRCVSEDEQAIWLIDYWCGKDVRGLIKMPFSRHWIMHIEAMRRIRNQLCKKGMQEINNEDCREGLRILEEN